LSGRPSTAGNPAVSAAAFPKHYRLIKTDEYSSVFGFRKALKSRHFLLHYRPRSAEESPGARLGLVVAKRGLAWSSPSASCAARWIETLSEDWPESSSA